MAAARYVVLATIVCVDLIWSCSTYASAQETQHHFRGRSVRSVLQQLANEMHVKTLINTGVDGIVDIDVDKLDARSAFNVLAAHFNGASVVVEDLAIVTGSTRGEFICGFSLGDHFTLKIKPEHSVRFFRMLQKGWPKLTFTALAPGKILLKVDSSWSYDATKLIYILKHMLEGEAIKNDRPGKTVVVRLPIHHATPASVAETMQSLFAFPVQQLEICSDAIVLHHIPARDASFMAELVSKLDVVPQK